MKKSEKNLGRGNLTGKSVKNWACPVAPADGTGVEMKYRGLKIDVILARWTY